MQTDTHPSSEARMGSNAAPFPPLELENRPTVATDQAAYYLTRQQQTLRGWACREDGPLRPLRINGRLAWKTADLRRLLGVA
ncbi:MAG: DNA-binding protein [Burkholderiales bacterium]|uniref:DNA-binding protein n=1 Tax=Roseateles sp. TaxID=1971397 RepID=UPI000F979C03|nr:MAG: DNA-binding protein [Burkholderiales bacterium]